MLLHSMNDRLPQIAPTFTINVNKNLSAFDRPFSQANVGEVPPKHVKDFNYSMNDKYYGVDVSKDKLDIYCDGKSYVIENTKKAIKAFVKGMPAGSYIAMESTNTYHYVIADWCHCCGMRTYVVNPRITSHYREVHAIRGHNDRLDALNMCKFIKSEHTDLREYVPKSDDQRKLETLIRRRHKATSFKGDLTQSIGNISYLKKEFKEVIAKIDALVARIDELIEKILDGNEDRKRLMKINGVGPVVSAVLVSDLRCYTFVNADAYVAFCGLDPKPNQSGKFFGRCKISKQGSKLTRCLLYIAAMSGTKTKVWKPIYEKLLARGLSKVQAIVCIARKILRTAWSIYTYKTEFDPARILSVCKN